MTVFSDIANPWVNDLGVYEPGKPIEEVARELGFTDAAEIMKLASNENALGPSPLAVQAMKDSASEMHRYPDGGAYYLKAALAEKLDVFPSQVLPVNGSNEAIEFLGHVFLGPDTDIVMADRAFVVYKLIAAGCRAGVNAVEMTDFTHDLDAMLQAITPKTRIVFISNPNNPTSTMVDGSAIDAFMEKVPDHVVVCFDEAYIELIDPASRPDTLKYIRNGSGKKVVVLRTFSKAYGLAGLRIGYVVASEDCIILLNKVRQPFNVNAVALAAAVAALNDDEHVERTRKLVADGLKYFVDEFSRLGFEYVSAVANFILVKVGSGRTVFEKMQAEGVIVRPMDVYGLPEYIRITVGTEQENRLAIQALEKVTR